MIGVLVIGALTCTGILASVLVKPQLKFKKFSLDTYWLPALLGAVLLLSTTLLPIGEFWRGVTANSAVNPLKILVLFLSIALLSIYLDEAGFFRYLAQRTLRRANGSCLRFFLLLYGIVSLLTIFTSNDIIVLTFTPFICYFCKHAKINPIPYLVTEFVAANTWSLMLIIGNPTNIYLASSMGVDFLGYVRVMWLPALCAGAASFVMLMLVFRKRIFARVEAVTDGEAEPLDKPKTIIGLIHLGGCTILLTVASYLKLEMWLITLAFAVSLLISALVAAAVRRKKPQELSRSLRRAPWQLIPFVLSMFALVLALNYYGVTAVLADWFSHLPAVLVYGAGSYLFSNILNNIPMSVLFGSILPHAANVSINAALYASVIGSNIGALLSPVGALAGIMWTGILKTHEVKFSFAQFLKYGAIISVPVLCAALGGLALSLLIA